MSKNITFSIIQDDITTLKVDAIVNAANSELAGGGGVDGVIHNAAGPSVMAECREIGGCPTGEAVITKAGNLPCKYIIHTVGPIWSNKVKEKENLLANAYRNSLKLAEKYKLKTIAFSNISTGVYGFPKEKAAEIVFQTVMEVKSQLKSVVEITFVCFDKENFRYYRQIFNI